MPEPTNTERSIPDERDQIGASQRDSERQREYERRWGAEPMQQVLRRLEELERRMGTLEKTT